MPSIRTWRMDEPARDAAYRRLHERMSNQDGCVTWLLTELRALQKRVTELEQVLAREQHSLGGERRKAGERRSDGGKDFCQPGQVKDDRGIGDGLSHADGNNRTLAT